MGELAASGRSGAGGENGVLGAGSPLPGAVGRRPLAVSGPPLAFQLKLPKKSECRRALDSPSFLKAIASHLTET